MDALEDEKLDTLILRSCAGRNLVDLPAGRAYQAGNDPQPGWTTLQLIQTILQ